MPSRDAEALAKVLYEAHGSWRSPELSHWEAASSEPDVRALYLHMAEAALRALAPANAACTVAALIAPEPQPAPERA